MAVTHDTQGQVRGKGSLISAADQMVAEAIVLVRHTQQLASTLGVSLPGETQQDGGGPATTNPLQYIEQRMEIARSCMTEATNLVTSIDKHIADTLRMP